MPSKKISTEGEDALFCARHQGDRIMKKVLALLAVVNLSMAALAGETPMMVSFKDLKRTALPETPGMQFAVLSGDPKTGEYTQIRKVPAGTDNPLHAHSSEIKNVI